MKISQMLVKVLREFSELKQEPNYGNRCFTASVAPQYKDVITFLLSCGIRGLNVRYVDEVRTEISSSPFQYEISGDKNKIKLIAYDKFLRQFSDIKEFLDKLYLAIEVLVKKLSEGWVSTLSVNELDAFCQGARYQNTNISGTHYVFLLRNIAKKIGINTEEGNKISFSTWVPHNGNGWNLADRLYLYGEEKWIKQFISSFADEFLSPENEREIVSCSIVSYSSPAASLNLSNSAFQGDVTVNVRQSLYGSVSSVTMFQSAVMPIAIARPVNSSLPESGPTESTSHTLQFS